jgi:hypothetical protein
LREPEVTGLAVTGSRNAQVVEATMTFQFFDVEPAPTLLCGAPFARVEGFSYTPLQVGCAVSRAPHGARVD